MSALLAARLQMAVTLGFHIILACLGVGLPVLMLAAEASYLKTGNVVWKNVARRWSKAFTILFAIGAVTGTVLSFEMGLLWPEFMRRFGSVIGLPFTLEAAAFFVEAIFAGIYLYGWDRLSPRAHWFTGLPVAIAGGFSAWFVVTANSWMNVPQGFRIENGHVVDVDPIVAMLNPATAMQTTHMIVAAYLVAGYLVASVYAVGALRGDTEHVYSRKAMFLGLILGGVSALLQFLVGHHTAKMVANTQPIKLAALEGQFKSEARAPLRIGGFPDPETRTTRYAIEIPGGLSWMAYGDPNAVVRGLDDFPRDTTPPVRTVHFAFQIMVASGGLLLLLAVWTAVVLWRLKTSPPSRLFLRAVACSGLVAIAGLESGWIVTEVGRQPWIVHGVMRTSEAATEVPGVQILLAITIVVYVILTVSALRTLYLLGKTPLPSNNAPASAAEATHAG